MGRLQEFTHFFIMEQDKVIESVKREIEGVLQSYGVELVEVLLKGSSNSRVLRILVDKDSGINISECAKINKEIGAIIEEKALLDGQFLLEVSSPGLDRPLKEKRDFEKSIGQSVEIWLKEAVCDQEFLSVKVVSVTDEKVDVENKKGERFVVPYNLINKARRLL
ncbi:MAG: hypothetical protein ABIB11_03725 [Candidatus Omnitrophota bacterium]